MTFKKCKNEGCEIQIEVRNTAEGWRPFEESGNMHQCQHSEYAKAHRAIKEQTETSRQNEEKIKNGNELVQDKAESPKEMYERYVDHTIVQSPKLKLKILTDPTPEGLALTYNIFGESHKIQFSQYHPVNALYTIAVFFEEIPLKH